MKILIATGGSGGHIFPALATANVLKNMGHQVDFAGVFGPWSDRVRKGHFSITELSACGFDTRSVPSALISSIYMLKSLWESVILLKQKSPEAVVGFGGYGAFPVVLTAFFLRIPTLIHEQNVYPGRANRLLKFIAEKIAVSFDESRPYFPSRKTIFTGYPLQQSLETSLSKTEAVPVFGLEEGMFTILVLGGSQGSQAINRCFLGASTALKSVLPFQVIHITGRKDYREVLNAYGAQGRLSFVTPFWENMPAAYQAADLVVARSGAGTITEIAAFGLPAILIPYPHARGHQKKNAQILERTGQGLIIEQKDLTPEYLETSIKRSYEKIQKKGGVGQRPASVFKPDAGERIAREVIELKA